MSCRRMGKTVKNVSFEIWKQIWFLRSFSSLNIFNIVIHEVYRKVDKIAYFNIMIYELHRDFDKKWTKTSKKLEILEFLSILGNIWTILAIKTIQKWVKPVNL